MLRKSGSSERGRWSRAKRSLIEGCGGAAAMERLTESESKGEYWATCLRVLCWLARGHDAIAIELEGRTYFSAMRSSERSS